MPWPLKKSFRRGDALPELPADWLNTVARILNDVQGVGITITKTTSGNGWLISLSLDDTTVEFNSVTGVLQVKDGGVDTDQLADDAVTADKIAAGACDTDAIGSNAVTSAKIANLAITTGKLAANAVTNAKLGPDAVTTDKITANTILTSDVSSSYYSGTKSFPPAPGSLTFVNGICTSVT